MQILLPVFALMFYGDAYSQNKDTKHNFFSNSDTLNKPRRNIVLGGTSVLYGATMTGLYALWYRDTEKTKFHLFDDLEQWEQMDKAGHVVTSYQLGRLWYGLFDWAGLEERKSLTWGGAMGSIFLSSIEVYDGFSKDWGFSISDVAANTTGSVMFIVQQKLWDKQRVTLKYSFNKSQYSKYKPDLLGHNLQEEILKDYNGQIYWICSTPGAWISDSRFPNWLGLGLGYGADGMIRGRADSESIGSAQFERYRQYYLSIDIDLSKVEFKNKFLNTFLSTFAFIRIPAPALEYNRVDGIKLYPLYF